ncbi:MAG: cytochrome c [Candidatus Obscuribacterales bacterium]|nr:cytochrome c [Candidatus Obscuribacterales bacterium]
MLKSKKSISLGIYLAYFAISSSSSAALSQELQRGKQLFQKAQCIQCHSLSGQGACLGPELAGIGKKRDKSYLNLRLNQNDESAYIKLIGHPELFPHPRFKADDVKALLTYLASLPDKPSNEKLSHSIKTESQDIKKEAAEEKKVAEADIAEGKKIFLKNACLACHSLGGQGGSSAPALDQIGSRRKRVEIDSMIAYPISSRNLKMPRAPLSFEERSKLIDFLLSQNSKVSSPKP